MIRGLKVWDLLFELNERLKSKGETEVEVIDLSEARLNEEIVLEKAKGFAQQEGWEHLVPTKPILWKDEKGNLVWSVTFLVKDMGEVYFGTRANLSIDDTTGEVITKHLIPR